MVVKAISYVFFLRSVCGRKRMRKFIFGKKNMSDFHSTGQRPDELLWRHAPRPSVRTSVNCFRLRDNVFIF